MKRILLLALCLPALAQAASISTRLSADETVVGSPVRFEIRVEGGGDVIVPSALDIEGIQTLETGRSIQTQFSSSGGMSSIKSYRYLFMPTREGDFDISVEVTVDGKREKTQPQHLRVEKGSLAAPRPAPAMPYGGAQPPSQQQPGQAPDAGNPDAPLAYAEVIIPKKSVYAGELVPVEIRFYFNGNYNFRVRQEAPQVSGEGFTVAKLMDGRRSQQMIDGVNYNVVSFKTALTAVKSGTMEIPKASLLAIVDLPSDTPSPADELFQHFFGGQVPGMYESRDIEVASKPSTIEVKPLPAKGRPANFNGAIGEFTVAATADPEKAAPGDPVTLKVAVRGRGNFDVLAEPELLETDGWREYPPTDSFAAADAVGFDGTKTFDFPLVAQAAQTRTPIAELSYFDPEKEQYLTIETQPVKVDAAPSAAAAPAIAEASATPAPTPTPEPGSKWIVRTRSRTFQPLLSKPAFWIVNGVALVAAFGWIAGGILRRAAGGPAAQRRALLRRRDEALRSLEGASDAEFYERAAAAMTLQAGLTGAGSAHEWARATRVKWSDETRAGIDDVLGRADEVKFGGGGAKVAIDPEHRRRVMASLKEACR